MTDFSKSPHFFSFSFQPEKDLASVEKEDHLSVLSLTDDQNKTIDYPVDSDEDESSSSDQVSPIDDRPTIAPLYTNPQEAQEARVQVSFTRSLALESVRRLPYRRRQGEVKTTIHLGQRKILMSQIEFLTRCGSLARQVIYVGAAPGLHIPLLAELFPEHEFHLFDNHQFLIQSNHQIWLHRTDLNDQLAAQYGEHPVLFISDLRTTDHQQDPVVWEQEIADNMLRQRMLVEIMSPKMSLLKVRFPYSAGQSEYLAGDLYFQVWSGQTSTETRLMTAGMQTQLYDHTVYNDALFRFNRFTRTQWYSYPDPLNQILTSGELVGLDHCYDCRAELEILVNYYRRYQPQLFQNSHGNLLNTLKCLYDQILDTLGHTASLDQPPHGQFPDIQDREERECRLFNESIAYQRKEIRKRHRLFLQQLSRQYPKHRKKSIYSKQVRHSSDQRTKNPKQKQNQNRCQAQSKKKSQSARRAFVDEFASNQNLFNMLEVEEC